MLSPAQRCYCNETVEHIYNVGAGRCQVIARDWGFGIEETLDKYVLLARQGRRLRNSLLMKRPICSRPMESSRTHRCRLESGRVNGAAVMSAVADD